MQALSKTAALREAASAVSIHGSGSSWIIIHPYDEIDGPCAETSADSYWAARAKSARIKAVLALSLMGRLTDRADCAIYSEMDVKSTAGLVEIGLRAAGRG